MDTPWVKIRFYERVANGKAENHAMKERPGLSTRKRAKATLPIARKAADSVRKRGHQLFKNAYF